MSKTTEKAAALIKRLREKPSTYNRELLDEAADAIAELLEELKEFRAASLDCETCKHRRVSLHDEPCYTCFGHSKWEAEEVGEAPRWDADRADTVCSVCGFRCDDTYYLGAGRFCPECGAKMAEPLRSEGGDS